MADLSHLKNIFHQFKPNCDISNIEVLRIGNINQTYIVESAEEKFILQSINRHVFPDPSLVMNNLNAVMTSFIQNGVDEFIPPILSSHQLIYHKDNQGDFWRVFPFVENFPVAIDTDSLEHVGFSYGKFIKDLSRIDTSKIQPTINHFHQLDFYYQQLEQAIQLDVKGRVSICTSEIEFIKSNQKMITDFKKLSIPKRLTHNDAKLDNVLFLNPELTTWKIIDYDTIMMGYSIFDYGDLVRSTLSLMNGAVTSFDDIVIDYELIADLKRGFIKGADSILSKSEIELLDNGVELILYEQAIRFLSDYLSGDIYYQIVEVNDNLTKARRHLWLLQHMIG